MNDSQHPIFSLLEPASIYEDDVTEQRLSMLHTRTSSAISAKRSADALEVIAKHLAPVISGEEVDPTESSTFDAIKRLERVRDTLRNWGNPKEHTDNGNAGVLLDLSRIMGLDNPELSAELERRFAAMTKAMREELAGFRPTGAARPADTLGFKDMGEIFFKNHPDAFVPPTAADAATKADLDDFADGWIKVGDAAWNNFRPLRNDTKIQTREWGTAQPGRRPIATLFLGDAIDWSKGPACDLKPNICAWRVL